MHDRVPNISEEEAELYDRQIRLWGIDSQKKLKNANILLLGMTPLAAEIAKNIVLAGVSSLTIADDNLRSAGSLYHTQQLNPMVRVQSASELDLKSPEKIKTFSAVIIATNHHHDFISKWISMSDILNNCGINKPYLLCATTMALFGIIFVDLGSHEFIFEKTQNESSSNSNKSSKKNKKSTETDPVICKNTLNYTSLDQSIACDWIQCNSIQPKHILKGFYLMQVLRNCSDESTFTTSYLESQWKSVASSLNLDLSLLSSEDFVCCCGDLVPAINPILGGIVSQEVIRAITQKGKPQGNWYFFDGLQCSMTTDWLPPIDEKKLFM